MADQPKPPADDIEVTTATRTPAEVDASNGVKADAGKTVDAAAAKEPSEADLAAAREAGRAEDLKETGLDAEALDEIERLEPAPAKKLESKDERRARIGRQTKRVLKEISKRKSAETERDTERQRADRLEQENATLKAGKKPDDKTAADKAAPDAAGKAANTEAFEFPSWEKWQEEHPDDDYTKYTDARTDARYAFNERKTQQTREREVVETRVRDAFASAKTHETAFKAEHADYDEVTDRVQMVGTDRVVDGEKVFIPAPGTVALQRELLKLGPKAPALNYYLGQHPEEAEALMRSTSPNDFLVAFGEIRYKAMQGSAAAPAGDKTPAADAAATVATPAPPAKQPKTDAPDPLAATRGAHTPTRSAAQISDDDGEDADGYIAERKAQLEARP